MMNKGLIEEYTDFLEEETKRSLLSTYSRLHRCKKGSKAYKICRHKIGALESFLEGLGRSKRVFISRKGVK